MSRPRFVLTPQARADLLEIWNYIAEDSPENADRVLIAYRDQTRPLQIIAIVHGTRQLEAFFQRRIGGQASEAAE